MVPFEDPEASDTPKKPQTKIAPNEPDPCDALPELKDRVRRQLQKDGHTEGAPEGATKDVREAPVPRLLLPDSSPAQNEAFFHKLIPDTSRIQVFGLIPSTDRTRMVMGTVNGTFVRTELPLEDEWVQFNCIIRVDGGTEEMKFQESHTYTRLDDDK